MPRSSSRASRTLAARADRHALYEQSVQCAEAEIDFVDRLWRQLRERPARLLREDFCGSALVCAEWVRRRKRNRAIGVDLDERVLAWGRARHLHPLPAETRSRVTLLCDDVRRARVAPVDIALAMNFSYWLFKERATLLDYFEKTRAGLEEDGLFILDAYGGYDAYREIVEEREIDGEAGPFTYIWEQAAYNPVDGALLCHIHFAFPDGSRIDRAFSYDWRLWTLAEIRELLAEAGFRNIVVHGQGFDDDGEPDGDFRPRDRIDADAGWICYLSAEP